MNLVGLKMLLQLQLKHFICLLWIKCELRLCQQQSSHPGCQSELTSERHQQPALCVFFELSLTKLLYTFTHTLFVLLVYIFVNYCKHRIVPPAEMSCYLFMASWYTGVVVLFSWSCSWCFIFPCHQNKGTIVWISGDPLSRLSGSLLIFHNWFSCLHPALVTTRDEDLQLSYKWIIYEKHTCHWKSPGDVSWSV